MGLASEPQNGWIERDREWLRKLHDLIDWDVDRQALYWRDNGTFVLRRADGLDKVKSLGVEGLEAFCSRLFVWGFVGSWYQYANVEYLVFSEDSGAFVPGPNHLIHLMSPILRWRHSIEPPPPLIDGRFSTTPDSTLSWLSSALVPSATPHLFDVGSVCPTKANRHWPFRPPPPIEMVIDASVGITMVNSEGGPCWLIHHVDSPTCGLGVATTSGIEPVGATSYRPTSPIPLPTADPWTVFDYSKYRNTDPDAAVSSPMMRTPAFSNSTSSHFASNPLTPIPTFSPFLQSELETFLPFPVEEDEVTYGKAEPGQTVPTFAPEEGTVVGPVPIPRGGASSQPPPPPTAVFKTMPRLPPLVSSIDVAIEHKVELQQRTQTPLPLLDLVAGLSQSRRLDRSTPSRRPPECPLPPVPSPNESIVDLDDYSRPFWSPTKSSNRWIAERLGVESDEEGSPVNLSNDFFFVSPRGPGSRSRSTPSNLFSRPISSAPRSIGANATSPLRPTPIRPTTSTFKPSTSSPTFASDLKLEPNTISYLESLASPPKKRLHPGRTEPSRLQLSTDVERARFPVLSSEAELLPKVPTAREGAGSVDGPVCPSASDSIAAYLAQLVGSLAAYFYSSTAQLSPGQP
ncbi:hypothetical protein JCM10212_000391 [Sporobolomyces blumeae]